MTRRGFLRFLGALPLVGPALLAVGAKVLRVPAGYTVPAGLTAHIGDLAIPAGSEVPNRILAFYDANQQCVIDADGQIDPSATEVLRQAMLEAFYRGRG